MKTKDFTCLYKNDDYKGKIVGCYEVIDYDRTSLTPKGQRLRYWKVKCIHCGNEKTLASQKVVYSMQEGCQKCVKNRFSGSNSWLWNDTNIKHVTAMYFHKTRLSAEKRNLEFSITREDMEKQFIKQNGKCFYTGFDLDFGSSQRRQTASIDRINSKIGYIMSNIQWIHKSVNYMKMDLSEEEFLRICSIISERKEIINEQRRTEE